MESAAAREQALSARLEAVERSRIAADLAAERAAGEHDTWQHARDTELQRLEVQAEARLAALAHDRDRTERLKALRQEARTEVQALIAARTKTAQQTSAAHAAAAA
eukprot:6694-Heterococcus_DN1.PRE.1